MLTKFKWNIKTIMHSEKSTCCPEGSGGGRTLKFFDLCKFEIIHQASSAPAQEMDDQINSLNSVNFLNPPVNECIETIYNKIYTCWSMGTRRVCVKILELWNFVALNPWPFLILIQSVRNFCFSVHFPIFCGNNILLLWIWMWKAWENMHIFYPHS